MSLTQKEIVSWILLQAYINRTLCNRKMKDDKYVNMHRRIHLKRMLVCSSTILIVAVLGDNILREQVTSQNGKSCVQVQCSTHTHLMKGGNGQDRKWHLSDSRTWLLVNVNWMSDLANNKVTNNKERGEKEVVVVALVQTLVTCVQRTLHWQSFAVWRHTFGCIPQHYRNVNSNNKNQIK